MDDMQITLEPGKRSGQPCIRGLRITVWDVLAWLAAGKSQKEILSDYPSWSLVIFSWFLSMLRAWGGESLCEVVA